MQQVSIMKNIVYPNEDSEFLVNSEPQIDCVFTQHRNGNGHFSHIVLHKQTYYDDDAEEVIKLPSDLPYTATYDVVASKTMEVIDYLLLGISYLNLSDAPRQTTENIIIGNEIALVDNAADLYFDDILDKVSVWVTDSKDPHALYCVCELRPHSRRELYNAQSRFNPLAYIVSYLHTLVPLEQFGIDAAEFGWESQSGKIDRTSYETEHAMLYDSDDDNQEVRRRNIMSRREYEKHVNRTKKVRVQPLEMYANEFVHRKESLEPQVKANMHKKSWVGFIWTMLCAYAPGIVWSWTIAKMRWTFRFFENWTRYVLGWFLPIHLFYDIGSLTQMSFQDIMFEFQHLENDTRLALVDVKVMIHSLYWLLNRDNARAFEHTSYLMLTRPIGFVNVFANLAVATMACVDLTSHAVIKIEGKEYAVDQEELNRLLHKSDSGIKIKPEEIVTAMETQSGMLESLTTNLGSWLASWKIGCMSAKDLELANKQYAFIKSTQMDFNSKTQLMSLLLRLALRTYFSYDPMDPMFQTFTNDIIDMGIAIDGLNFKKGSLAASKELMTEVVLMWRKFDKNGTSVRMSSLPAFMLKYYNDKHKIITDLAQLAHQYIKGAKQRSEPVCVLVSGKPGSGKSPLLEALKIGICRIDGQAYSPEMTYLVGTSKFFSGYANQKFVVIDDAWKIKDKNAMIDESARIIGMVNTNSMNLDMAEIESKGVTFFDSPYVFITTNYARGVKIEEVEWDVGLKEPAALKKRFHLILERDEPSDIDVLNNTYRVAKCDTFPEYQGRMLNPVEIAGLVKLMRNERDERLDNQTITATRMDELLDMAGIPRHVVEEFEVQNGPEKPPDAVEWMIKIIPLQMAEWMSSPWFKWYCIAFALLVLLVTVPAVMRYFIPTDFETQSKSSRDYGESKASHSYNARRVKFGHGKRGYDSASYYGELRDPNDPKFQVHASEMVLEPQAAEVDFYNCIKSTISKGVVYMEFWFSKEPASRTYSIGIHVKDKLVLLPAHSIVPYLIEGEQNCMLVHMNGVDYEFDIPRVMWVEDEDAAFFVLPRSLPIPLALYKYLPTANNYSEMAPTQEIYQVGYSPDRMLHVRSMMRIPYSGVIKYQVAGEVILMQSKVTYIGDNKKGHSGCPSIIETPKGPIIVGMHLGVAGKDKVVGVSMILCKEWVDQMCEGLEPQSARVSKIADYIVEPHLASHIPTFSRIKASPIIGWKGPPKCVPVKFRPFEKDGQMIDPLALALTKIKQEHFVVTEPYNDERALEYLKIKYPRTHVARLLTYEEALNGSTEKGIPSIVSSTSAGYPYSLHAKKGKAPYVVQVNNKLVYQPEFLADLKQMEANLRAGKQIEVIWADTLKDETKEREKVEQGKVRLFSSCPLQFLILFRIYVLDFITELMKTPSTGPIAIGINAHSLDWTVLCKRIDRFQKSIIAGDFANFDGSIIKPLGQSALKFVNWWYDGSEVDTMVRNLLFEHFWESTHICEDVVYTSRGSGPTGQPATAAYNSLIAIVANHIVLTQDLGLLESDFEISVYGDDNIIGVNKADLRCSDMTPHFLRRFGMKYTHFSKTEGMDPIDNINTVKFLGRSFVLMNSKYAAPRDLGDIIESTYWVRGKDKQHVAFCSTVLNFFLDLSHYDLQTYNKYSEEIMRVIKEADMESAHEYLMRARKTWFELHDLKYDINHAKKLKYYMRGDVSRWTEFEEVEKHPGVYAIEFESQSGSLETVDVSQNREFTERATNVVKTSQEHQLGSYKDVAPVGEGAMNQQTLLEPQRDCNMEVFTLDDVLQREFSLTSFTWNTSDGANTLKATYDYPSVLFAQPFIQEKIKDFRMFRASIRITIRVVATKFLYGKLMVTYWPVLSASRPPPATLKNSSSVPHVIVSASAGDAMVFDVPFVYYNRAIDLANYANNAMGSIYIRVMNPLIDVMGEVSSAQVFITSQFRDAELFLPHDAEGTTLSKSIERRYVSDAFEKQSGSLHRAPGRKITKSLQARGAEARKKIKDSTISQVDIVKTTMDSGLESANYISSYISEAAQLLTPLVAMMGLSKPKTTNALTIMKVNPFCDINTGTGVDFSSTIGMDPENAISTLPNVAGCSTDELDFRQFCGTPVLSWQQQFVKGNTTPQILAGMFFQAREFSADYGDYPSWLANMFLYVSGSKKVKIYITASLYHSARFVLYLSDSTTSANWQNCYHMIIDVQGDTEVEFTLPYTSASIAFDTSGDSNQITLQCFPLSWSQPDDIVDAPIYFNVYTAAANDIEFGGLVEQFFETQSCPRADFAQVFPPFHESMLSYSPVNMLYGEKYTTLRQVIHKYQAIAAVGYYNNYKQAVYGGGGNVKLGWYTGLELIGNAFHFWRGSIRYKIVTPGLNPTGMWVTKGTKILSGTAIASTVNQVQEIEVPYYYNQLYLDTSDYSDIVLNFNATYSIENPLSYMFSAAGDDFSFHFQCFPRPDLGFEPAPTAGGIPVAGFSGIQLLQPFYTA